MVIYRFSWKAQIAINLNISKQFLRAFNVAIKKPVGLGDEVDTTLPTTISSGCKTRSNM
jgi:hypothetical protein